MHHWKTGDHPLHAKMTEMENQNFFPQTLTKKQIISYPTKFCLHRRNLLAIEVQTHDIQSIGENIRLSLQHVLDRDMVADADSAADAQLCINRLSEWHQQTQSQSDEFPPMTKEIMLKKSAVCMPVQFANVDVVKLSLLVSIAKGSLGHHHDRLISFYAPDGTVDHKEHGFVIVETLLGYAIGRFCYGKNAPFPNRAYRTIDMMPNQATFVFPGSYHNIIPQDDHCLKMSVSFVTDDYYTPLPTKAKEYECYCPAVTDILWQ